MEHHADLLLLNAERQQGPYENSHPIDTVHVQHLAEVTANFPTPLRIVGHRR